MHDFYCADAKDLCYKELADRVRSFKETEKGVDSMCEIWDEVRSEGEIKRACEIAIKMIKDGTLSLEKIADFSGLPIEKVRELAGNKSA